MRLKPEKIDLLAQRIVKAFGAMEKVKVQAEPDVVQSAIKRVILADLEREDDLEREAAAMLRQYQHQISMQSMSYNTLLTRAKQELARKRKIVL